METLAGISYKEKQKREVEIEITQLKFNWVMCVYVTLTVVIVIAVVYHRYGEISRKICRREERHMFTKNFGNISRAKLIEAIGPYTTTIHTHITAGTPANAVCKGCARLHLGDDGSACAGCPQMLKSEEITEYVYEKKICNLNNKLSLAAIKLYLYLHLTCDGDGYTCDFDLQEFSEKANVTPLTVKNCLEQLRDRNYIQYSAGEWAGYYMILIKDYKRMFLKASQGGSGYLTISGKVVDALFACPDVNTARCMLRLYDSISTSAYDHKTLQLKNILSMFPRYVTRKYIVHALNLLKDIFTVTFRKKLLTVTMDAEYYAKKRKDDLQLKAADLIRNRKSAMVAAIQTYQTLVKKKKASSRDIDSAVSKIASFGIRIDSGNMGANPLQSLSEEIIRDLAQIGTDYSPDLVLQALVDTFNEVPDWSALRNLGGYIRSLVADKCFAIKYQPQMGLAIL